MNAIDCASHPFLSAPATRAIMAALNPDHGRGHTRFVGGCVRNALMGRPVADIDCATVLLPEQVIELAEAAGFRVVPTGLDHGTVTVIADHQPFEVTTLRVDVASDGRHAEIAFTHDWIGDSARRDFRLNAIYADPDGTLFDPQDGIRDALDGRVRFIGDPRARLQEDYLRALRFFRFSAHYGQVPLDGDALGAIASEAKGLRTLSAERVWKEIKQTLAAPDPEAALVGMRETGVLEIVLPEVLTLDLFRALLAAEREKNWPIDPMLRLMALIPRFNDVAQRVSRRLRLSNSEADRLLDWTRLTINPRLLLSKRDDEVIGLIYGHELGSVRDRTRLAYALDVAAGEAIEEDWQALFAITESWQPPPFPLKGGDLKDTGIEEGPQIGATLKALEALWVRSGFSKSREELIAAVPLVRRMSRLG
jgi:poly(A) polymerase